MQYLLTAPRRKIYVIDELGEIDSLQTKIALIRGQHERNQTRKREKDGNKS